MHRLHAYSVDLPAHTYGRNRKSVAPPCACMGGILRPRFGGDRAWCRVVEFADEFGISLCYDPLVLAELSGRLKGHGVFTYQASPPRLVAFRTQPDPAGGGSDRSLALAGDRRRPAALGLLPGPGEPEPLALAGDPYQRRSALEAPQADAIVVLSGGRHPAPGPARLSEWDDPDRFLAGIDLFRAGKAPRLLFTGVPVLPPSGQRPEGQHYLQQAALFGVPASAMASTSPVLNTADEAVALRTLLPGGQSRVLLVTSAFHMRRAQRLLERQGIQVLPFPVDFRPAAVGQVLSCETPTNGCPALRPWERAHAPCGNCWGDCSI